MRDLRMQRRVTLFFGIFLSIAMVASLILPLLQSAVPTTNHGADLQPTAAPTLPAPIADLEGLQFENSFLHQSGLYTGVVPSGWELINEATTENEAQATFRNSDQISVIEMRVIEPLVEISDANSLNDIFTTNWLNDTWREYTSWTESNRSIEDDRLVMNFSLNRGTQEFIARQVAYTDGEWVYTARVITPPNASEMLQFILNKQIDGISPNKQFLGQPFGWVSYSDDSNGQFVRFPQSWAIVDSAPGAPATIEGDSAVLRVETTADAIASEDDAIAWVEGWRDGVTSLTATTVEQNGLDGWRVSYELEVFDSTPESGVVVLLTDDSDVTHIANVRVNDSNVDLNSDALAEFPDVESILNSFSVFAQ